MKTRTLGIVDLGHLYWKCWYSHVKNQEDAVPSDFEDVFEATCRWVREFSREYPEVIIACDAPPYLRCKILDTYKANRGEKPPHSIETLVRVQAQLKREGFNVCLVPGYEADDVAASAVYQATCAGWESVVLTRDKDLFQLVSPVCSIQSTETGTVLGPHEVVKKMGVRPDQILDYLCIVGDASDGIPGVTGVGAKGAVALLQEHDNIIGILNAAERGRLKPALNAKFCDEAVREILVQAAYLVKLDSDLDVGLKLYSAEGMLVGKDDEMTEEEETMIVDHLGFVSPYGPRASVGDPDGQGDSYDELCRSLPQQKRETPEMEYRRKRTLKHDEDVEAALCLAGQPMPAPIAVYTEPKAEVVQLSSIALRPGLNLNSEQFKLFQGLAKYFADSGLYKRCGNGSQAAIFTIMELGLELGISPQVALNNFHIIEGKPSPSAHFLIAMAKKDPNCEYLEPVEETDDSVTYETKKKHGYPKPMRFTYSMADATRDQQKWAKGGKNYKAMLRKTAGSQAARLWYPEACSGLYSAEELSGEEVAAQ